MQPCAAEATEKAGQGPRGWRKFVTDSKPQGLDPLGGEKLRS